MLSIGKLTPGRAAYYTDQLPGGRDEYYTSGEHEATAVWLGSATGRLQLEAAVGPEQFGRLLDAVHPTSGEPLGVPRTTARRLAGFDLCFSAPKSVSVAWALAPLEVAARIAACHDRAVAEVIEVFEAEVVRARRGRRAATQIETEGIVAAAFGHRSSRAGDPQMHTHVVVPNLTVDRKGRWSALAGDRVYRWAKTLGYLYQSALRHELSNTLGVSWGPVRKGAADIDGIDPALIDAFSKRRVEITAAMAAVGGTSRASAQTATLATRAAKDTVPDLETLREMWRDQVHQLGVAPLDLPLFGRTPVAADFEDLTATLLGSAGLTANASSFDRRDLLQALAAEHPDGAHTNVLRQAADEILDRPEVLALGSERPAGQRYTTVELLDVEARILERSQRRQGAHVAVADAQRLDRVLAERSTLSDEQQRMVRSLTTSGAGVEVVVGRAGAGKTYALDAAQAAWQASGHTVIGTALAARAAAELQAGTGIPSNTLDSLFADLDRPGPLSGLAPKTIIVCDEAGMIGTRKLARLLDHAERGEAKVVLVGDHHQLPEIEAGGAFAALARTVTASELTENRRQTDAWERAALAELRSGSVSQAFTAYERTGRVTLASGVDQARETMVSDWFNAYTAGERAVMYALRRADVDDLNHRARTRLDHAGRLGDERLEMAGREFAAGDNVICLRNDRRLGVRNGTTATVTAVHPDAGEITLENGTRLPHRYLADGHLDHGYATTVHKAQGATVDRAFLLGSEGLYREAGYVGLSRARESTQLYIVTPPSPPYVDTEIDPVVQTIRRLGESRAQTLATEQPGPRSNQVIERGPERAERLGLLADPAPWLTDTLGPPPLAGPERERWARTAERIAAYRDIYAITNPSDPIGPRPEPSEQRRAWDLAQLAITEHQRPLELEQGLHL